MLGPEEVDFDIENPSAPNFKVVSFPGLIRFPGSVQWYVIDQPFPYEIELIGSHVGYRVYQGKNMSSPKPPYNGECSRLNEAAGFRCKFTMYTPPYYVQVFGTAISSDPGSRPDRTQGALPYQIVFRRLNCSSMSEACMLEAAKKSGPFVWPQGPLHPSAIPPDDNTMYFTFGTELARNGHAPTITFRLDHDFPLPGSHMPDVLSMSLVDKKNRLVCAPPRCPGNDGLESQSPAPPAWHSDAKQELRLSRLATAKEASLPGDGTWTQQYFLKVTRNGTYQTLQKKVWVTFETDLTYFRPLDLYCVKKRTENGYDDLAARFHYDSVQVDEGLGADWSNGRKIEQAGTTGVGLREWPWSLDGAYLQYVRLKIYEVLHADDLPLDALSGREIQSFDRSTSAPVDVPYKGSYTWSDSSNLSDATYRYEMTYQRTHSRPSCRQNKSQPSGDCIPPRFCQYGACKMP